MEDTESSLLEFLCLLFWPHLAIRQVASAESLDKATESHEVTWHELAFLFILKHKNRRAEKIFSV